MKLGIKKGDRVGIWMQNYPEWVMAWFGISRAGAVAVPVGYGHRGIHRPATGMVGRTQAVYRGTVEVVAPMQSS